MRNFGAEILARPAFKGKDEEFEVLGRLCHLETDIDKRLEYVQRGRKSAEEAKKSCAMWDLLELPIRLERNETEEMGRLVQHLQAKHINEPGVADALVEFLVQIGAIRPDGTPAGMPPARADRKNPGGRTRIRRGSSGRPTAIRAGRWDEKPALWTPGMD